MNNFKISLDKYLTTPLEDGFDQWCDIVVESFTDDFFEKNKDWVMEQNGQFERWVNKLINREPKQAAQIIERAFRRYVKQANMSERSLSYKLLDDTGNDLLVNSSANKLMQEAISKLTADIHERRQGLILGRLNEFGIEIDLEKEKRRRFKSLSIEHNGEEETIYYNNGSENGLRIITFVTKQKPFDAENMSIGYETSFY